MPSYSEGVPNLEMDIDLVAAIDSGFLSYWNITGIDETDHQRKHIQKSG